MNISYISLYIKSHVTTEDSGSYTCIATNRAGGILMSDNKTVEVIVLSSEYKYYRAMLPALNLELLDTFSL